MRGLGAAGGRGHQELPLNGQLFETRFVVRHTAGSVLGLHLPVETTRKRDPGSVGGRQPTQPPGSPGRILRAPSASPATARPPSSASGSKRASSTSMASTRRRGVPRTSATLDYIGMLTGNKAALAPCPPSMTRRCRPQRAGWRTCTSTAPAATGLAASAGARWTRASTRRSRTRASATSIRRSATWACPREAFLAGRPRRQRRLLAHEPARQLRDAAAGEHDRGRGGGGAAPSGSTRLTSCP